MQGLVVDPSLTGDDEVAPVEVGLELQQVEEEVGAGHRVLAQQQAGEPEPTGGTRSCGDGELSCRRVSAGDQAVDEVGQSGVEGDDLVRVGPPLGPVDSGCPSGPVSGFCTSLTMTISVVLRSGSPVRSTVWIRPSEPPSGVTGCPASSRNTAPKTGRASSSAWRRRRVRRHRSWLDCRRAVSCGIDAAEAHE